MPAPSAKWWKGRAGYAVYELILSWWRHRASFLISVGITIGALALYGFAFLGDYAVPIVDLLQRIENSSLDTRFRYRSTSAFPADSRIVVVAIDQHSQEVFGKWPFSRAHFAKLLHVLHEDGAKVAAFDVTFSKPDESAAPVKEVWAALEAREKKGKPVDPELAAQVKFLVASYDSDRRLAEGIQEFGAVVLGNYFLYTDDDLRNVDQAALDAYADQLSFFAFPQVRVAQRRAAFGKQDYASLMGKYDRFHLLPRGTEANMDSLTGALGGKFSGVGFFNNPSDTDGVVRKATMILPFGKSREVREWDLYGSLDVMSVRAFYGLGADNLALYYDETGIFSIDFGQGQAVRPSDVGQAFVNYHGGVHTYSYYSMADVVQGKVAPEAVRGKIVLIGATATGIGDIKATPFGGTDYPGVEIHANVIDNILHNNFLIRGGRQQFLDLLLIFTFGMPLGFALALVAPRWMWFGIAILPLLMGLDYVAFLHGWWLNFTVPAMTLTGNVVLVSLYRALIEEKEKRRVRTAFSQYLSPEVIRRLLVNPELVEPRKTEITVMFSDIRGFTTISEKLDAQDLATLLNLYLSDMTRIVFKRQGTLDKYIGDAVMAFWGAPIEEPGHANRSCESALDMMQRVGELQKQWENEGKPRLDIGIGLNTGVASVGSMGSTQRRGYTALGDTVNLSSRLEGLNKDYGTHIIVTESTHVAARDSGFVFRELDVIRVKGKLQPVTIYELVGRATEVSPETQDLLARFVAAHALYKARRWQEAQQAFQSILETWPADGPSRTYWKRCQEYLFDEPPLNWDGVFTMEHK
jgi:adenylate cyclase